MTADVENEQELAAGTPDEQESETGPLNVSSVLIKVSVKVAPCPALNVSLLGEADNLICGRCLTVVLSVADENRLADTFQAGTSRWGHVWLQSVSLPGGSEPHGSSRGVLGA